MDLELQDAHVLVAGGSRGIGLACAAAFIREGARVTIVSRSAEHLHAAREELARRGPGIGSRIGIVQADLTDPAQALVALDSAERDGGPVSVLVNSAGAARRVLPEDLRAEHWHEAMSAKFFSYVHLLDPAVKRMASRGAGAVVNIVGVGGKVAGPAHLPGGAANAALMLVSAGLAKAYGASGVRVNAVNPGVTNTDRFQSFIATEASRNGASEQDTRQAVLRGLPLGRPAEPEEVADAVVFLASARARYINGAILTVDGGVTPMI